MGVFNVQRCKRIIIYLVLVISFATLKTIIYFVLVISFATLKTDNYQKGVNLNSPFGRVSNVPFCNGVISGFFSASS